ncbi:MAG: 16S rRNA (cytosine(967)-C(5))-methyltransferase RsmB [Clostridiales bacterium]|nr:16S rRNA (cytosine(967)-C(5))-methyltransferase RsmB [Clostridiales bacterium]
MSVKKPAVQPSAREIALLILLEVEKKGAYANLALKQGLDCHSLNEADKRLISEIVYGSIRMQAALDYLLAGLLNRPLAKLSPPIRQILRLSLYQLLYLERLPRAAIVHQAVELAKRYGHAGTVSLTNGVLRAFLRLERATMLPDESNIRAYLNITLSYPGWLVDYLLESWPAHEVKAFCRYHNQHQGLDLRINTLRTSREEFLGELAVMKILARAGALAPESLIVEEGAANLPALLAQGNFTIQGQASQLAAHALNPKPGSKVIDLCAAPGGKTTHLAQLMQNSGEILALDLHPHRLRLLEENAARMGINIITAMAADGRELPISYHGYADYLLLDAPCSGLGVLGRRADARWRKQPADIEAMADLSGTLLRAAAAYVKPGGYLCYTTCTITKEENTQNISRFLAEKPDFRLTPMIKLAGFFPNERDKKAALSGYLQLLPQIHGVEGFFITLLRKEGA